MTDAPETPSDSELAHTLDAAAQGRAAAPAVVSVGPQSRIGHFVLLRQIGQGGMGAVFAAYDESLDRKVALKILRTPDTHRQLQRTLLEAKALARICHPNVVAVYEVSQTAENVCIAMEYVEGCTLKLWQAKQERTWQEVLAMYQPAGQGLAAAHQAGIVHRDFKPENVLIGSDGRPRVADFGIARLRQVSELATTPWPGDEGGPPVRQGASPPQAAAARTTAPNEEAGRLTLPGVISGTPGFMSPEQYRGGDVDARSDQFSFCAALFEGLYGQLPFPGETFAAQAENVYGPVRKPPSHSQIPQEIYQTLLIGLKVNPGERFVSMDALLASLAIENSHHAGAGGLSLRQFVQGFLTLLFVAFFFAQLRTARGVVTYRQLLSTSALSISVTLIGGLLKRRTLLENQFHRRIFILFASIISLNFGQRLFGLIFKLPVIQLMPFELLALAANIAVAAAIALPALWWVPIMLVAAAVAVVLAPETMRPILLAPYSLACFYSLITWVRHSGKAKREMTAERSTGRSPERPTPPEGTLR